MAGYRPKSLEELNSLYDKSINVKNEIERKASDLEIKQEIYTPASPAAGEAETVGQEIPEEKAAEEISGLVDDFIKSFGAPAPAKKVRPVAPATVKAVSSAKNDEMKTDEKQSQSAHSVISASADKPRLIRNSERNDLFENYKKVMDDEDEDDYSFHRRGRKRGKKLFEKKSAALQDGSEQSAVEDTVQENASDSFAADVSEAAEADAFENEIPAEEIPETLENIDAVIDMVLGRAAEKPEEEIQQDTEPAYEIADEQPAEAQDEAFDEVSYDYEQVTEAESDYEEEMPVEQQQQESEYVETVEAEAEEFSFEQVDDAVQVKAKKSYAGKNLLLCALLLVLVLATAVSAVKAFAGINSDVPVLEKYHLYTADAKYIQAGIKKGDLVVVSHEPVAEGSVFAYKKGDGRYGFAKLDGVLKEDTVIADTDGQKSIVFKNTIRGVYYKSIPAIGTFAAVIASYYIYFIGGLLLIAAILMLVLIFAFREKKVIEAEQSVEAEYEIKAEAQEGQYDDVEGDFRYLIQEEVEDDYDVYRSEESDSEEGLPVYEPDDYKYEPDEYVNN